MLVKCTNPRPYKAPKPDGDDRPGQDQHGNRPTVRPTCIRGKDIGIGCPIVRFLPHTERVRVEICIISSHLLLLLQYAPRSTKDWTKNSLDQGGFDGLKGCSPWVFHYRRILSAGVSVQYSLKAKKVT